MRVNKNIQASIEAKTIRTSVYIQTSDMEVDKHESNPLWEERDNKENNEVLLEIQSK